MLSNETLSRPEISHIWFSSINQPVLPQFANYIQIPIVSLLNIAIVHLGNFEPFVDNILVVKISWHYPFKLRHNSSQGLKTYIVHCSFTC
jgi:hypothetical protein